MGSARCTYRAKGAADSELGVWKRGAGSVSISERISERGDAKLPYNLQRMESEKLDDDVENGRPGLVNECDMQRVITQAA